MPGLKRASKMAKHWKERPGIPLAGAKKAKAANWM